MEMSRINITIDKNNKEDIIYEACKAMKDNGKSKEEVDTFRKEANNKSYGDLLIYCTKYFNILN